MRTDPYARTPAPLSPHRRAFAVVVLLHAGAFVLLQSVMQLAPPAKMVEVVTAQLITPFRPPEAAPPPAAPPKVQPPQIKPEPAPQTAPVLAPQPPLPASPSPSDLPAISVPKSAPALSQTPASPAPTAAVVRAPVHVPVIVPAVVRADSCALPRYPAASERLHEEGVVSLKFLISENGQVVSGSVEKSSGYKRLDDAALAALSLCKFKPATVDGKPRQEWSAMRYRWELKD